MVQSRISAGDVSSAGAKYLSEPERLLERARVLLSGAPAINGVAITLVTDDRFDSISVQLAAEAPLEHRCALVDWFANKLGAPACTGMPRLGEAGYASYGTDVTLGANRPLYINVYTQIAKGSA